MAGRTTMLLRRAGHFILVSACALASAGATAAQSFPPAPSPAEVAEAAALLSAMKTDERGPYARLRWFCADGTVHAPQGTPCRERGGGVQHAEPDAEAGRLAAMGYAVGTILQATGAEELRDADRAGYRLREMVLERFLIEADDGWVLRRARYYRGALQIEDEERAGARLLAGLFADGAWLSGDYFLASRLAEALPHSRVGSGRSTDRIRALATEVAERDPGFMRLRVKIHSLPSPDDAASVDAYLRRGGHAPEVTQRLTELRDALRAQYDPARALAALDAYARRLGPEWARRLGALQEVLRDGTPEDGLRALAETAAAVRRAAEAPGAAGALRLDLLDLGGGLHERAFVLAQRLDPPATRREALERFGVFALLGYASGFYSGRELEALRTAASELAGRRSLGALEYKTSVGYLSRSLDWARGTVRGTFQPVLDRYVPVEPIAAGLPDALLRGSVVLPLSRELDALQADADAALGTSHVLLGESVAQGVRGLNPGVALRPLRFLEPGHEEDVDARTIYVLPETPPELKPVAGVLTLAEGNLLSHVQLLARNLGIPNASLSPGSRGLLEAAEGREVFYAVTPLGRVILRWPGELGPEERALVESGQPAQLSRVRLDTSRLRLDRTDPIPVSELRATDSGVLVGPKAANLGQLAADFPGRVSAGVALPFGMFLRHVERPFEGSERTVAGEIRAAYRRAAEMRGAGAPEAEVNAFMLERLAWVRRAIEGLEWIPEARAAVVEALVEALDGDVSRGVFVRSDTNVEDLPQFSGAGLNLTVPHQTSVEEVLASIRRVWTSPFTERAYLWRAQILDEQGEVYPSVLLQESVPSERSGVLITSGIQEGGPDDLTVVVAEGVGGAVEGEDAETLLVGPDGSVRLLSQAKAPRRRQLRPGGTRWVAAERPDTLLRPDELRQLREVVAAWKAKKEGTPEEETTWDMEVGFVDGRLWLFQVRPFVRFRNSDVQAKLEALDREALARADRPVRLDRPLGGAR